MPGAPPTGFLPDHPLISGLLAGLIGSDLTRQLYGGPVMGDADAALAGFALRVVLILGLAWLLFRAIGNHVAGSDRKTAPRRREPQFGSTRHAGEGRRDRSDLHAPLPSLVSLLRVPH